MLSVYSIYDRVSATYGAPFVLENPNGTHGIAKRYFPYIVTENPTYSKFAEDMDLYCVGSWDAETGLITGIAPDYIMRYIKEDNNE